MKRFINLFFMFFVLLLNAQYTHSFKGYNRDSPNEVQFSFIPLSISNDLELNQFELGWRKGFTSLTFRYGLDNFRTNYFDINSQVYFWITKHIDITAGAGFGTRTNLPNGLLKDSSDKYYIPYNVGVILKPSNYFQIITKMEKFDLEHDWYFQTGIIIKLPLEK